MSDLFGGAAAPTLKVLSLWQPWASLKAAGVKLHETRHWVTSHRGPIAIHASKRLDLAGAPDDLCQALWGRFWMNELPLGAVVSLGEMTDCRKAETVADHLTRADLRAGNFSPGRYAWRIENDRRLHTPILLTGRQGLFNWTPPADLAEQLGPILDHGAACRRIGWA